MSKAEELIACLEGEIAKRDARIAELEARYQRDVYGLNNEGDPIGGDPAGGYANDNARLRTELAAIKAQEPVAEIALSDDGYKIGLLGALRNHRLPIGTKLYAAPVSEAKAQVYEPLVCDYCNAETQDPWHGSGMLNGVESRHIHACSQCRNLLPTTKAQGVVMPAELDRAFITGESCDGVYRVAIQSETLKEMQAVHSWLTSLNAAPAAPAADGWIPVSERLPAVESRLDQECRVGTLSITPLNISAAVLVFDGEKVGSTRLEWFDGCLPLPYCITHWMPLPAAPAAHRAKEVV